MLENFNILAWVEPPSYTGLSQINIDIKSLKDKATVNVPFSSELLIQTTDLDDESITVILDEKHKYKKDAKSNNFEVRFKVKNTHNVKLVVSDKVISDFNLEIINDEAS